MIWLLWPQRLPGLAVGLVALRSLPGRDPLRFTISLFMLAAVIGVVACMDRCFAPRCDQCGARRSLNPGGRASRRCDRCGYRLSARRSRSSR